LRLFDGVLIVIDSIEGVTKRTEKFIKIASKENLDMIIFVKEQVAKKNLKMAKIWEIGKI